jgi:hypothetical protein
MRTLIMVCVGALLAAGCGGPGEPSCPPDFSKEITSSNVVKEGNTWNTSMTSNIGAPIDKVLDAATHPERGHDVLPESVLKSEIVNEDGNSKTVDFAARLEVLPPGFKVQNIRTAYTYYPEQKKFTTKSVDFKLADISSEYQFEPSADGKGTTLKFTQTMKDHSVLPDSVQKGAQCETFALQVKVIRHALGLEKAEPAS